MSSRPEKPSIVIYPEKTPCNFNQQEDHLNAILSSRTPFQLLSDTVRDHISERSGRETFITLRSQIQTNPDDPNPRLEIVWDCLPSILTATSVFRGLGINNHNLITQGLEIAQDVIYRWISPPSKQDYLTSKINAGIKEHIETIFTDQYGLDPDSFPTLKLYLKAVRELEDQLRHPAQPTDLPVIEDIINSSEGDNYWESDILSQIHEIYTQPTQEISGSFNNDRIETIFSQYSLRKNLNELINSLPDNEPTVIILRYHERMTLDEIGKVLNLTRQRIAQIEQKALLHLLHALKPRKTKYFSY
jgi:RNA polymerase sigma factor (sigma-70 family)